MHGTMLSRKKNLSKRLNNYEKMYAYNYVWKYIFRTIDVSSGAAYMMAPKEDSEMMVIKKACQVSVDLFNKYLKEQVMEIVDADKKVWNLL